jgi:hypothetical protein
MLLPERLPDRSLARGGMISGLMMGYDATRVIIYAFGVTHGG